MAKFCGNCGAKLGDSAKVCGVCGTPLEDSDIKVKINTQDNKKNVIKRVKTIIAIVVIIVIGIIGVKVAINYTGYNGFIRKAMAAYQKYDIDALASMVSEAYYYSPKDDYAESHLEYKVGGVMDYFDDSVGHNCKYSYEINETYVLSGKKLNDTLDRIEYEFPDFDTDDIKKIVVADITITAKQGKKSLSSDFDIYMSKEKDGWKLLFIE